MSRVRFTSVSSGLMRYTRAEQPARPAREPGYTVQQRYAVTTTHETWALGDDALAKRLALLHSLLDELERRRSSAELANVDGSRIALTGFDLGAQTVMAAAGETEDGRAPFELPATVKCIVAFSPYADFSGTAFDRRFAAISVPVMSVTSTEDVDPLGVVTSPALRRAPFENMPPGHKYLLSLAGAPHALIAGKETAATNAQDRQDSASTQSKDDTRRESTGGRRKGGMRGMQISRRGGAGDSDAGRSSRSQPVSAAAWTAELVRAQTVTTAYFDAFVRDDPVANEWLAKDARRWLADSTDLVVK